MSAPIEAHWPAIRRVVRRAFQTSFHCAFATVDPDGVPRIVPIGSLLLDPDRPRGLYFEVFARPALQGSGQGRVAILAVDSSVPLWLFALVRGRFARPPAVRLYGSIGPSRPATSVEQARWRRRVRWLRRLRGYDLLWGNLATVCDIAFDAFEPVWLGSMTGSVWNGRATPRAPRLHR